MSAYPLTVEQALALLADMPKKAVLVIDGKGVTGLALESGRLREGYFTHSFTPHPEGRVDAVRFTRPDELSDGTLFDQKF